MIKINDLHKSFGDKDILKGLNLTVNDGECVCIIGKSGIGKSILLKHITGLMTPDKGEVWLHDQMINTLTKLQPGFIAPHFKLRDQNELQITNDDFKNKFIYISFFKFPWFFIINIFIR